MHSIKKISAAIALVALSMIVGVASVGASPETPQFGTATTPLLSSILSSVNVIGDDAFATIDPSAMSPPPTQHYGPYLSSSPDSGSCGNDWATDTFDRHFSVFSKDDSIVVVQQFKDFSFVTPASDSPVVNMSPGACNNGTPYDGGVIASGVTGSAVGYFIIQTAPGTYETSNSPYCDATLSTNVDCTTTKFIDSHFSCTYQVTCTVSTFYDHYTSPITSTAPNSGLIVNEWKDASADRGGMSGDIRST
jgi:hypothetical protein